MFCLFKMFHCSKKKKSDEEIRKSLRPGESYCLTSGVCGSIYFHGEKCGICGREFQYSSYPYGVYNHKGFFYHTFGKYKPQTIWYCTSHKNKQIEKKIRELDI